ncbi:MAG: hypothetical protein PHY92_05065 [Alphaproteobacteria bacterium]|nr:hypothetical protein [Alphaproteobacteria bacterium]
MPEQLKEIFPLFPEDMRDMLVQVATGHTSYLRFQGDQDANLFVPMSEGQKPMGPALIGCADSRMGKWIVGRKGETAQVLECRLVGAIGTHPVDINSSEPPKLIHEVNIFGELASHYDNGLVNAGHDKCGHHTVAYVYHMVPGGKQKVWDDFGPAFVQQAENSKYLVDTVINRINTVGLRHYRDLGFDLGHDPEKFAKDPYKFTLAMTIEQTEFNRVALEMTKEAYDNNPAIKNKFGVIGTLVVVLADAEKEIRVHSSKEGIYFSIPALDHSLVRKAEAERAGPPNRGHGAGCTCCPK